MSFQIQHSNKKGFEEIILQSRKGTQCSIIPTYGAALNSFVYAGQEWVHGYNHVDEINQQAFKGVVLAPFANRIVAGKYNWQGKEMQLPINRSKENVAIHGFLYNKVFELVEEEISTTEASVVLSHFYEGDLPGFPFPFSLTITYTLNNKDELLVETTVVNESESYMPFSLGFHPYFAVKSKNLNDAEILFPPCKELLTKADLIPIGECKVYAEHNKKVDGTMAEFDTCFELDNENQKTIVLKDKISLKSIEISAGKEFNYFQIYTPTNRESIAIEPMTAPANAFNSAKSLVELEPDVIYLFSWKMCGI